MLDYQYFLNNSKAVFDSSERHRLHSELWIPWQKLRFFGTDRAMDFLLPFYSSTGRPATNQPQIILSFVLVFLFLSMGLAPSLTSRVARLKQDCVLAAPSSDAAASPSSYPAFKAFIYLNAYTAPRLLL